ncbi:hypothetical protein KCU62_g6069, partial [Aureobasidium sp. EXF-3399]
MLTKMAHDRGLESDEPPSPSLNRPVTPQEEPSKPEMPSFLTLPAELLHKIHKDSGLRQDDRAKLRLVCKEFLPYATEALAELSMRNGFLCLNPSANDFERLAALCSSQLGPYLTSVHFLHYPSFRSTKMEEAVYPRYSAIQNVKFGTRLYRDSTFVLKRLLLLTNHLKRFEFNPAAEHEDDTWSAHSYNFLEPEPAQQLTVGKDEERERASTILSSIKSDCLSEVILTGTILSYKPLLGLLTRYGSTIRKLSFHSCRLVSGTYVDLLQWMSTELPALEHLDLQYLHELKWRRSLSRYDFSKTMWEAPVTLDGKKDIDTYIASLQRGETSV